MYEKETYYLHCVRKSTVWIVLIMCFKLKSIKKGCGRAGPLQTGGAQRSCHSSGQESWALKIPDIWRVIELRNALQQPEQPSWLKLNATSQTGARRGWRWMCLNRHWKICRKSSGLWKELGSAFLPQCLQHTLKSICAHCYNVSCFLYLYFYGLCCLSSIFCCSSLSFFIRLNKINRVLCLYWMSPPQPF